MQQALAIAAQFFEPNTFIRIEPIGNGLINDTYQVAAGSQRYILQKINSAVFPRPQLIIENHLTIIEYRNNISIRDNPLRIPALYPCRNKNYFFIDSDNAFWRVSEFIENTRTFEQIHSQKCAEQVGIALAQFHALFCHTGGGRLHDTLPGFHITPNYLNDYLRAEKPSQPNKLFKTIQACIEKYQTKANILEHAKASGLLTDSVIHGDPKLNNILFDVDTLEAVSMIDLDTVKQGLIHYDIGDCLRSCCQVNTDHEDNVKFDLDICELILKAYVKVAQARLTLHDFNFLYDAILLIPFELGLRFCTDFLNGNCYFKVDYPEQNLQRAFTQFQLMHSIEQQQSKLKQLISDCQRL